MRPYFIKQIIFSGYKKFGAKQVVFSPSYPDFKTKGSGLNIIVGSIGSGKSTLLEVINAVCGNGFRDNDKMIINDSLADNRMPKIEAKWISPEIGESPRKSYSSSLEFTLPANSRLLNISNNNNDYFHLDEEDYPSGISSHFVQPNRLFIGDKSLNMPASSNSNLDHSFLGSDYKTNQINLTPIGSAIDQDRHGMGFTSRQQFEEKLKDYKKFGLGVKSITTTEPQRNSNQEVYFNAILSTGKDHALQDLSDGNKELLYWLYELNFGTLNSTNIICIDEIERSLHPQLQQKILEILYEKSTHQQIFITTHSVFIADHLKANAIHRIDLDGCIHTVSSDDFPKKSIYNIDHRRLLFTDKAIFIEGPDDYELFSNKLNENNEYKHLADYLFIANSKSNISNKSFEKLCGKLGITFGAIVDDDFSDRPRYLSKDRLSASKKLLKYLLDNNLLITEIKLEDIQKYLLTDTSKKLKSFPLPMKSCRKLKDRNIFVLKYGRYEEYSKGIDRDGRDVKSTQDEELNDIFAYLKEI